MKTKFKILWGAVALSTAGQVLAATDWVFTSSVPSGVSVSAYANTGGTDTAASVANNAATQTIQSATNWQIWSGSGIGINNADNCTSNPSTYCDAVEGSSPEHAIDNNQRYDMALLSFTGNVNLTALKLGWMQTDSDMTVMAYTGAAPFSTTTKLIGATYDQLIALGWTTIGNYANVGTTQSLNLTGTNAQTQNAGEYSSYWLIGAYNPLAAGTTTGLNVGNDYVKLASVSGNVCTGGTGPNCTPPGKTPEPGSMALFGLAFVGMMGLRRRQQA